MTEGVEHVMERNKLWGLGDAAGAWYENRILEKYYAPMIDPPSYHSKTGHRWPDEQRAAAQLASTLSADGSLQRRAYVSQSNPAPIFTWPKWRYWIAIAAFVLLLIGGSWFLDRNPPPEIAARAGRWPQKNTEEHGTGMNLCPSLFFCGQFSSSLERPADIRR
jgi:hypothetical protein